MDSLMGVEFGLAAQKALGDDIPLMSVSDALSIRDIASRINLHLSNETEGVSGGHVELDNLVAQHEEGMGDFVKSQDFVTDVKKRADKIVTVIG